jgi:glutamate racemase
LVRLQLDRASLAFEETKKVFSANFAVYTELLVDGVDDPAFVDGVRKLLEPTLDRGSDRLVLGCTHYTFLTPILTPIVAGRAELIDVADAVARQCVRLAGNAGEGSRRLILSATALPERLQGALHRLGLGHLQSRQQAPVQLASVI